MKLLIKQPKIFSQFYEIYNEEKIIGTLSCSNNLRTKANADIDSNKWVFERKGIFNNDILIKNFQSETPISTFHSEFWGRGGSINLGDGHILQFKNTSFWKSKYAWIDESGKELIKFIKVGSMFKFEYAVDINEEGSSIKDYHLLVILGLYKIKLLNDAAAAAVA